LIEIEEDNNAFVTSAISKYSFMIYKNMALHAPNLGYNLQYSILVNVLR
jgi:hypothetical protein